MRGATACALTVTLALATEARAGGLDQDVIGTGLSGPATHDAAAVYHNPAALAWLDRPEVLAGAGLVAADIRYRRERRSTYQTPDSLEYRLPLSAGAYDAGKTGWAGEVRTRPVAAVGDAFVAFPVIRDRLVLGLGFHVPYAASVDFPANGPQAFQIRQAFLLASNTTLAAGLRVTDTLSLGAGLTYVLGYAELSRLQDFAALDELDRALESPSIDQESPFGARAPTEVRELDTLARPFSFKRGISHGATFHLGASWAPDRRLRLGVAYQHSSVMRYEGSFALDMGAPFFTRDLAPHGLAYPALVKGDATLRFTLPRRLRLGASVDATPWLRADLVTELVVYSDLDAFEVETRAPALAQPRLGLPDRAVVRLPRDWNDTVRLEGRLRAQVADDLALTATLGYQSPASPDSTIDAASPDGHRLIGGAGALYEVGDGVSLHGDLRVQRILQRTVTSSDLDLGNGTYDLMIASLAGHLRVRF